MLKIMRTIGSLVLFLVLGVCPVFLVTESSASSAPQVALSTADTEGLIDKLDALNISTDQYYTLLLAREIGAKYGLGKSLMAITWQEDKAGGLGPVGDIKSGFGKRSYGICQVKLKTAKETLKRHPSLGRFDTDEELIAHLILDKKFNLEVAAAILNDLQLKGLTWEQMVQQYNYGYPIKHPGNAPYTKHVAKLMKTGVPAKVDALEQSLPHIH